MNAQQLLDICRKRGVEVTVNGGSVVLTGEKVTPALSDAVREHEDELLTLLAGEQVEWTCYLDRWGREHWMESDAFWALRSDLLDWEQPATPVRVMRLPAGQVPDVFHEPSDNWRPQTEQAGTQTPQAKNARGQAESGPARGTGCVDRRSSTVDVSATE